MTENRGTLPKSLWLGVKAWWGADYDLHPEICREIFSVQTSSMAFEEDVQITSISAAPVKSEGGARTYNNIGQGYTTRYTHIAYANGYQITREQFADNQYAKVARARTKALSKSHRVTKETVAANILNRSTSGSYLGADGVSLLSTAHPEKVGTFANRMSVAADLSESSLEDILILIMTATDSVGDPIMIKPKRLIIPPQLAFVATRILKSTLQSGTANNDTNAMREMGLLQGDPVMWNYLTDPDAWYVQTDVEEGLKLYQREAREITKGQTDDDTDNLKVKSYERFSVGYTDPRCIYGSPGAG
jgi:Mu-like prophage major head subunit gpT